MPRVPPSNTSTRLPYLRRRNVLLPLADLCQVLRLPERRQPDELNIVVVQVDGHRFGLVVDAINDTEEIVVKPLWQQLKSLNCYAGATIMGDGGIALILDVAGIGLRSGVTVPAGQTARRCRTGKPAGPTGRSPSIAAVAARGRLQAPGHAARQGGAAGEDPSGAGGVRRRTERRAVPQSGTSAGFGGPDAGGRAVAGDRGTASCCLPRRRDGYRPGGGRDRGHRRGNA